MKHRYSGNNLSPNQAVGIAVHDGSRPRAWFYGKRKSGDRVYNPDGAPVYGNPRATARVREREKVLEHVTLDTLKTIERFLEKGRSGYWTALDSADRKRLAEKYGGNVKAATWMQDGADSALCDKLYRKFVEYYPQAEKYGSFKALQYAAQYGDTPCIVYKEDKHKEV